MSGIETKRTCCECFYYVLGRLCSWHGCGRGVDDPECAFFKWARSAPNNPANAKPEKLDKARRLKKEASDDMRKASESGALSALLGLKSLIEKAQRVLGDHLALNGLNSEDTINALYGVLDGSEQRERQAYADEIIRRLQ